MPGQETTTRPIRIAVLLSSLGRGGAQRQAVVTAAGLRRRGHDARIVCLRGRRELDVEAAAAGVPVVVLGSNRRFGGLAGRLRLLASREVRNTQVIYSFMPSANVMAALVGMTRRRTAVAWGIRDSGLEAAGQTRRHAAMTWMERWLARRPDIIICNSEAAVTNYTKAGFPIDAMVVIPNGIDTDRFRPDAGWRLRTRAALGIGETVPLVLCLARADPMKGHADLVVAFGDVARRVPTAVLVLVGDHEKPFEEEMRRIAATVDIAERVHLLPGTPHPERLLQGADVLVVPSRFGEGFSNVLGEAMACGLAVVATDVGDARRIVDTLGAIVPARQPDRLAAELVQALNDPLSGAEERRARIVSEFSVGRMIDSVEAVLVPLACPDVR